MKDLLVRTEELVFPDYPQEDDERMQSIESASVADLPPIILIGLVHALNKPDFFSGYKWVIVDGCRRAFALTGKDIKTILVESDEDVMSAAEIIEDPEHQIHVKSITTFEELAFETWRYLICNVLSVRPINFQKK